MRANEKRPALERERERRDVTAAVVLETLKREKLSAVRKMDIILSKWLE
jgi:hypothetical protein